MSGLLLRLLLVLLAALQPAYGLSCLCGNAPCQTPACCPGDSPRYTKDVCGCCLVCAKEEGEVCGGPWGVLGTCREGTRCLRECECKTTEHGHRHNKHHHDHQHDCIFPFVYRGKTYHECTTDCLQRGEDHKGIKAWCDKTEMRPWCATKINKKDVMKDWELCGQGCPGTEFECDKESLFNSAGRCVRESECLASQGCPGSRAVLDPRPGSSRQPPAPACRDRQQLRQCVCAEEQGRGGCLPSPWARLAAGWCFLQNLQDPAEPSKHCYDDVEWSAVEGRFWSRAACQLSQPHQQEGELLLAGPPGK